MPGASAKKARAARALLSVLLLLALSVFALLAAVAWGSTGFKVREVLEYLVSGTSNAEVILFKIRLPRALLSYLVGGGLAVAGCCLQGVFKNPMADSHILGVSAGAGFGAAACIALGIGGASFGIAALGLGSVAVCALLGGILAVMLVTQFARVGSRTSVSALLLSGVAVSSLFTALTSGSCIVKAWSRSCFGRLEAFLLHRLKKCVLRRSASCPARRSACCSRARSTLCCSVKRMPACWA